MVTVVLKVQLDLPGVTSLKEKRRILKSMIARLRNNFNISVAEIDGQDSLRSAFLGAAVVSNSTSFGHQVMSKVVGKIQSNAEVVLADYVTESY